MYTDEKGKRKTTFSESIKEAEEKAQLIAALKEKLFEDTALADVISIEEVIKKAA
jgi:hypothetical protein